MASLRAIAALALLLAVTLVVALSVGAGHASLARALGDPSSLDRVIVAEVRLPRVLLGALAGAGLSLVGVALQSIFRNPLAEPYLLGVSGGSALGATVAILFGAAASSWLGAAVVPLAALLGGVGATVLVQALARTPGERGSERVLLAGVVVNAIASSAITFLKTLVSASKAQELLFWLMGFLDVPSSTTLVVLTLYLAVGSALLLADAGRLNVIALGDTEAHHLGVDVAALERRVLVACSLVVGAIVSVTGLIGFIGLVVPHALRRVLGHDVRVLMPASLVAGAAALVACDALSRSLFRVVHTEPPVGAVTALLGGPLLLALLRRRAT